MLVLELVLVLELGLKHDMRHPTGDKERPSRKFPICCRKETTL